MSRTSSACGNLMFNRAFGNTTFAAEVETIIKESANTMPSPFKSFLLLRNLRALNLEVRERTSGTVTITRRLRTRPGIT